MPATTKLSWSDVIGRKDLIGGDMESQEDHRVFRGPLREMKEVGDMIHFTSAWCARMSDNGTWEKWDINLLTVSKVDVQPQDIGEGRIHFELPFLGHVTLFPKGGSKLEPHVVKGLPPIHERLLALYPDLPFDREAVEYVLKDRAWEEKIDILKKLPVDAVLADLLSKFRADSSKEEFLWYYIEKITPDKEVHEKVY